MSVLTPLPISTRPSSCEGRISLATSPGEGSQTPALSERTYAGDEEKMARASLKEMDEKTSSGDRPPEEQTAEAEAEAVSVVPAADATAEKDDGKIAGTFELQTNYLPRSQLILIFLALAIVIFTVLLDQTTLAVSSSVIATDLSAGSLTSFITGAYFLTSTSFQLIYGRVSDLFGRKPLILFFLAMFFVGSLGSSLAPDVISLVCFRAFTGIWGGGLITLAQTVIGDVVSLRERGKYQGILGSVMILGNGLGPIIGGALAEKANWRDQYRLMLPLSAFAGCVAWRLLPLKKVHGDWKKKASAVDWTGAVLTFIATTLVVLGLSWAGGSYSWSSAHVLAPLIIGVGFAVFFCVWQWKGSTESRPPLMPLHMFRNRIVCGAVITQLANGWLTYVQMFYIPQFYQLVYGYSPIHAGALMLPLLCVQSLSSTLSGLIVSRTGRYREILLSGWMLWSIGLGLFSTLTVQSGLAKQIGYSLLTGFGVGQTLQVALVALQGAVPRKEMAVVTATRNFARNLGAALGIAIASTIVNTLTINKLIPLGWSAARVRSALDNPSALFTTSSSSSAAAASASASASSLSSSASSASGNSAPLSTQELIQLRQAYTDGFHLVFLLLASIAATSFFVTVALLRQRTLTREDDAALKEEGKRTVLVRKKAKESKKKKEGEEEEEEEKKKKTTTNKAVQETGTAGEENQYPASNSGHPHTLCNRTLATTTEGGVGEVDVEAQLSSTTVGAPSK